MFTQKPITSDILLLVSKHNKTERILPTVIFFSSSVNNIYIYFQNVVYFYKTTHFIVYIINFLTSCFIILIVCLFADKCLDLIVHDASDFLYMTKEPCQHHSVHLIQVFQSFCYGGMNLIFTFLKGHYISFVKVWNIDKSGKTPDMVLQWPTV